MKKIFFLIFTSLLFLTSLTADEAENPATSADNSQELISEANIIDSPAETAETAEKSFPADFVLQFEPGIYINSESSLVSAPSPIIYPISIGFLLPEKSWIAVQPTISFFMMNHLFYQDMALPAEIENRTTTTLGFMLNIPAVFSFYLENSSFQLNCGLGAFMRFGLLAAGVKDTDSGWTGSAGTDAEKINNYFWEKMRWLYLTAGGSWLYNLTPQLRAGPTINVYLPVGGLISDQSAQAMIISAGIKICR